MKVVHALRSIRLSLGGPPVSLIDICQALHHRGHAVSVLSPAPDDVPARWLAGDGPAVIKQPVTSPKWGRLTRAGVRQAADALRGADMLHLHMPWDPLNHQLARIARSLGVPYCVSTRGTLDDWAMAQKAIKKRVFMSLFGRRFLEGAAFVHCTAEGERLQSERWYPRGRTVVIPNLLDMAAYERLPDPALADREFGIPGDAPILLYLSRIHPGKGLEHVIRAMPDVLKKHPSAQLIVAGDGAPGFVAQVRHLIEALRLDRSVRLVGFVSGEVKTALLCRASVFLLPSSHENFGNAVFHAAACGTPVVITRQVETWRELWLGRVARVVQQDPWEIGAVVNDELSKPADEQVAQGRRVRDWTLDFFGGDRIIRMYEDAYSTGAGRPDAA
jgi:glycosyltransferase involved in cell wall biosynthesis